MADLKRVIITGANGSLGQRLSQHLLLEKYHLLLLDDYEGFHRGKRCDPTPECSQKFLGTFEHIQADLTEWGEWTSTFQGADAAVHFAAVNPYPEATWEQSRLSMRMSANVVAAAQRAGVRRLVLTSSSHVLGGYLQGGALLSATSAEPELGAHTPLCHFTRFRLPGLETDASGYAAAKVALEELGRAAAASTPDLSVVVVRIGWCQPGENHPSQMSATATPTISAEKVAAQKSVEAEVAEGFDDRDLILSWLHRLWLSTRDFRQLFLRAIESPITGFCIVSGVSRNDDMRWSSMGWAELGYAPADDVVKALSSCESKQDCPPAKRLRV